MVGCDPSARLRTVLRVVFRPGDFQQDVAEHLAVVGDGENVLLDGEMDGVGVGGVWCLVFGRIGDVVRFWIPVCTGMTWRSVGAWWRTKRVMQGVVDLCDQPGGLGSVLGDGGGRFGKRPAVVVTGFGSRVLDWERPAWGICQMLCR